MKRTHIFFITLGIVSSVALGVLGAASLVNELPIAKRDRISARFFNYDGTFLWETDSDFGASVTYGGATPKRGDDEEFTYTFSNWDKSLSYIEEDTNFYAQFFRNLKEFKVTFLNYNQDELYVDHVARGNSAEYFGTVPTRASDGQYYYKFSGWDRSLHNIVEDTVITAKFEAIRLEFAVNFLNYDKNFLYKANVLGGGEAIYRGLLPIKPSTIEYSYTFLGWDKTLTNVQSDFSTTAVFKEEKAEFMVSFLNYDGTLLYTDYVPTGGTAKYLGPTPTRASDQEFKYTFSGWNKDLDNINENITVTANFVKSLQEYVVKFLNYDDTNLHTVEVEYGKKAIYKGMLPTRPDDEKYTYTFIGWDRDIDNITEDLETYALYEAKLRIFDVIFLNYDGEFLERGEVEYGDTAVYFGDIPVRNPEPFKIFKFIGWDKPLEDIKDHTTFIAEFELFEQGGGGDLELLVVFFYNFDSTLLDVAVVREGEKAVYRGPLPTRAYGPNEFNNSYRGYSFDNWNRAESLDEVFNNIITYAQYRTDWGEYIVTYRNNHGVILYEDFVNEGLSSTYRGVVHDYLLYENGFLGWSASLDEITKSITVYPVYR